MTSGITDQMRHALKLIKQGKTPKRAAEIAGVKRQSIYVSVHYKKLVEHMREQEKLALKGDAA